MHCYALVCTLLSIYFSCTMMFSEKIVNNGKNDWTHVLLTISPDLSFLFENCKMYPLSLRVSGWLYSVQILLYWEVFQLPLWCSLESNCVYVCNLAGATQWPVKNEPQVKKAVRFCSLVFHRQYEGYGKNRSISSKWFWPPCFYDMSRYYRNLTASKTLQPIKKWS